MRRQAAMLLCLLALAACGQPPRPFQHDDSEAPVPRLSPGQRAAAGGSGRRSEGGGDGGRRSEGGGRTGGAPKPGDPAISKTRARPEDYAEASERLVSRIAQQAAPRVATLIGKPPTYQARSPGQVAAGMSVPDEPPADAATAMASANLPGPAPTPPAQHHQPLKGQVAPT